jgi:hypothetical protein
MYNYKRTFMVGGKYKGIFSFPAMKLKHSNPAGYSAETRRF